MFEDNERIFIGAVPHSGCGQSTFSWVHGALSLIRSMSPGQVVEKSHFEKLDPTGVASLVIIDESSIAMQIREHNDPGALSKELENCMDLLRIAIHETQTAIAYAARDSHIEPNKIGELISRGTCKKQANAHRSLQGIIDDLGLPGMGVEYLANLSPSANVAVL